MNISTSSISSKSNSVFSLWLMRLTIALSILYPLLYLGIGKKYPWVLLGKYGMLTGAVLFTSLTVCLILSSILLRLEDISLKRLTLYCYLNIILAAIFTLIYDFIQYKHFLRFGYTKPYLLYLLDIVFIVVISYYFNRLKLRHILIIAALMSVLHLLISMYYFPLVLERSDMLIANRVMLWETLHKLNPYNALNYHQVLWHFLPIYSPSSVYSYNQVSALTTSIYFPMTFLSFLPGYLLHIDFRLVGLMYWLISLYVLIKNFDRFTTIGQLLLVLIIINPYWLMRHDLYFQFFILELIIIFLYYPKLNWVYRALILGVFIATYQFALVLAPFIVLAYSDKFKYLVMQSLVAIMVAFGIITIFTHGNYADFLKVTLGGKGYLYPTGTDITFGIAPIFSLVSNAKLLYMAQIFGCLVILITCMYQYLVVLRRDASYYMCAGAICYFYFLLTNYFLETYLWVPVLITLVLATSYLPKNKVNPNKLD